MKIKEINPNYFDWSTWRSGNPSNFGLICRSNVLILGKHILSNHAVGYANAASIPCRPKPGQFAVMFFKDDVYFWFHLTKEEFNNIFI